MSRKRSPSLTPEEARRIAQNLARTRAARNNRPPTARERSILLLSCRELRAAQQLLDSIIAGETPVDVEPSGAVSYDLSASFDGRV